MPINVIIIAGGALPQELHSSSDARVKALLRIGEHTLLERAAHALAGSSMVGEIAVVGNDDVLRERPAHLSHVEAGSTIVDNLYNGFMHHGGALDEEFLVLSPDLPFITTAALDEFLTLARSDGELVMPLVTAESFLREFPGASNKFERLDGKQVTMGSCFYLTGRMLKTNIPLAGDLYRMRKNPLKMAAMIGLPMILSYLSGRAKLAQVEARMSQLTGGKTRAAAVSGAGLVFDIDGLADYEYALGKLNSGKN